MPYMLSHTFHDLLEDSLNSSPSLSGSGATGENKRYTLQKRALSYRFATHFHPYVATLVRRLIEGSIRGLQETDTEYQEEADGTLVTRPGSTRGALVSTIQGTRPDGTQVALPQGMPVILPDGVEIALPATTPVVLPVALRVKLAAGTPVTHPDGGKVTLRDDTQAVLPVDTRVMLSDALMVALPGHVLVVRPDRMPILLPNGMQINLPKDTLVVLTGEADVTVPSRPTGLVTQPATAMTMTDTPVTPPDGTRVALLGGSQVEFPAAMMITLPDGSGATLPAGTRVGLIAGVPRPKLYEDAFFTQQYDPSEMVSQPHPVKELDFTSGGAYAVYNWELFYHVPLTIAVHLSKNHHFAEAQRWFHFVFDPTDDSEGSTPERFWKVKPFQYTDVRMIEEILINLSTQTDPALRTETINSIGKWKNTPFRPHAIARYRQSAYMFKAVMAYLDNLIAWGDALFRQDTGENIEEATEQYVLAANILGPRPQELPQKGSVRPQTYANLKNDLNRFGNALRDLETAIGFDVAPLPVELGELNQVSTLQSIGSLGKALYFCVPRNDKLLGYWDTVADRLFKIHNSLNIRGIFRQLPLFDPPIDPALLARAAAAGLDVGAIVNGLNQPLPLVRFQFLVQKAAEICQEVKALGNNLLGAIEKADNEALAVLRAKHERVILGMTETVRYQQWQDAIKSREGLETSLANAVHRYIHYERLLGRAPGEINIPELEALDTDALDKMKFSSSEPVVEFRDIDVDIAQDLGPSGGKLVSSHEAQELEKLAEARDLQDVVQYIRLGGQAISLLPQFGIKFHFWGLGGDANYGGFNLGKIAQFAADVASAMADRKGFEASNAAKVGAFARREEDWAFQSNLAAGEINLLYKQLTAAQIREHLAEREWKNHQQQIRHSEEIERFLTDEKNGKMTNQAFYMWMKREVKGLYGQCFQFAFDVARKAERALQHELGDPNLSFLQFGYLTGKEGLLAGEKLFLDIKRMEMAYYDRNPPGPGIIKHVSLLQINPEALIQFRATGMCSVHIPEEVFDMDCPGQYFRRIKSVAISIPCVVGPYTSVNCRVTMTKSFIRRDAVVGDAYAQDDDGEDPRFSAYLGSMQSIVTSTGQNDSGLFETNLQDEWYLPFEGSGVISEWRLELLSRDMPQFDYDTITDVIFHLRYTAREGGEPLRQGAVENLVQLAEKAQAAGSVRLFSVRHEFPSVWAKFKAGPPSNVRNKLSLHLGPQHYPFWTSKRTGTVQEVRMYVEATERVDVYKLPAAPESPEEEDPTASLSIPIGNLWTGKLPDAFGFTEPYSKQTEKNEDTARAQDKDTFTLYLDEKARKSLENLWLAVKVAWQEKK